jgi:four helix bundle protein
MGSFRDLIVYKKAFDLSMAIFHLSKKFPVEERYSLTDQVRRSSRSVCVNLAEGYRKRQYPAHFSSKASDADMENTETSVWLDFALACGYIDEDTFTPLKNTTIEIGRLLYDMIEHPEKYAPKNNNKNN